jgi:hypothetical protein
MSEESAVVINGDLVLMEHCAYLCCSQQNWGLI